MFEANKTSKTQQRGVRQEFFNKPCKVDGQSLAGSPCCFHRIYLCTDAAVRTVRLILFETRVLPQGSSGTGQIQDWTGGYAAGVSKQDVYRQRSAPTGSHFQGSWDESQSSCSCASSHRHVQLHSISHPFCFKLWTRFFLKTKIQEDDCHCKHWPGRFWILFNCVMA